MTENFKRFRQNRVDEPTREKFRETSLSIEDLILPLFIVEGTGVKEELSSMQEVFHLSVDQVVGYLSPMVEVGLRSVLLFGVHHSKGVEQAYDSDGIVQKTITLIKTTFPQVEVICDVCICSFTESGHCHIGDNDSTIELLAKIAVSYAHSGADIVAPSDMMDGRVWAIRSALDKEALSTPIMSYAAKYASHFYGPFRDAADCAPQEGDRRGYQMDYANTDEAMLEVEADIDEGAQSIIIKPALSYLDIIRRTKDQFDTNIVAYNVSGEYSILRSGVDNGIVAEMAIYESLLSMKRAGADRIITYFVPWFIRQM